MPTHQAKNLLLLSKSLWVEALSVAQSSFPETTLPILGSQDVTSEPSGLNWSQFCFGSTWDFFYLSLSPLTQFLWPWTLKSGLFPFEPLLPTASLLKSKDSRTTSALPLNILVASELLGSYNRSYPMEPFDSFIFPHNPSRP